MSLERAKKYIRLNRTPRGNGDAREDATTNESEPKSCYGRNSGQGNGESNVNDYGDNRQQDGDDESSEGCNTGDGNGDDESGKGCKIGDGNDDNYDEIDAEENDKMVEGKDSCARDNGNDVNQIQQVPMVCEGPGDDEGQLQQSAIEQAKYLERLLLVPVENHVPQPWQDDQNKFDSHEKLWEKDVCMKMDTETNSKSDFYGFSTNDDQQKIAKENRDEVDNSDDGVKENDEAKENDAGKAGYDRSEGNNELLREQQLQPMVSGNSETTRPFHHLILSERPEDGVGLTQQSTINKQPKDPKRLLPMENNILRPWEDKENKRNSDDSETDANSEEIGIETLSESDLYAYAPGVKLQVMAADNVERGDNRANGSGKVTDAVEYDKKNEGDARNVDSNKIDGDTELLFKLQQQQIEQKLRSMVMEMPGEFDQILQYQQQAEHQRQQKVVRERSGDDEDETQQATIDEQAKDLKGLLLAPMENNVPRPRQDEENMSGSDDKPWEKDVNAVEVDHESDLVCNQIDSDSESDFYGFPTDDELPNIAGDIRDIVGNRDDRSGNGHKGYDDKNAIENDKAKEDDAGKAGCVRAKGNNELLRKEQLQPVDNGLPEYTKCSSQQSTFNEQSENADEPLLAPMENFEPRPRKDETKVPVSDNKKMAKKQPKKPQNRMNTRSQNKK